jgi:hypothetical protein
VHRTAPLRRSVAVPLLVGALLAACGQPDPPPSTGVDTVSVPIQPTITSMSTEPETIDPSAAGSEGLFDASANLTTRSCAATAGVWSYSGSLTNPESSALTFTVAIILVKAGDLTPVETKEIDVRVPAGGSAPIEAKAFHTDSASDLECLTGVTVKEN